MEGGGVITSRGPGTAIALVQRLAGRQKRRKVEAGLVFPHETVFGIVKP